MQMRAPILRFLFIDFSFIVFRLPDKHKLRQILLFLGFGN